MTKQRLFSLFTLIAAPILGSAGCGVDAGDPPAETPQLSLELNSPTDVAGRVTDGAPVAFRLMRDSSGEHIVVTTLAGTPLVEARIDTDGQRTARVLDGRLVVQSTSDGTTTFTGDRQAEADVDALPEAQSLRAIEPTLARAGIDSRIFAPSGGKVSEAVSYLPCGSYAAPGQYVICGTNWLGSTTLRVRNFSQSTYGSAIVWFLGQSGIGYYINKATAWGPGENDFSQWFWGSNFVIQNVGSTELQLSY